MHSAKGLPEYAHKPFFFFCLTECRKPMLDAVTFLKIMSAMEKCGIGSMSMQSVLHVRARAWVSVCVCVKLN